MPRPLTGPIGRALVELARPDGPVDLGPIELVLQRNELDDLSALVDHHRLDGPFVDAMTGLDAEIPHGHLARVAENRVSRMRARAALVDLAAVLDAHEIEWVVVKGPVVSSIMRRPEHRAFNDLDLVVAGPDLDRTLNALNAAGADELNRNWDAYVRHEVGEIPMAYGGVAVDLHWSLIGLGVVRRTMRLATDAMVRRRVRVKVNDGVDAPVLCPVDGLLYLCVHSALSGASRLDQLRDIAVVTGKEPDLDWDLFVSRARASLVAPLVAHALDRASRVLGASAPGVTVEELGGTSFRLGRWIDSIGSPSSPKLRGLHVKCARNDRGARWSARRFVAQDVMARWTSQESTWDFADPHSVLYQGIDAGGPAGRRRFIKLAG